MKNYIGKFFLIFGITIAVGILVLGITFAGAILGYWGNIDDLDVQSLTLSQNSNIVYLDPDSGEEVNLLELSADENRKWVELEATPQHLQYAFISIEDERFAQHNGVDIKRTAKATLTWFVDKVTGSSAGASLGGSTITQQLIKNITGDDDQTPSRKIQEISRAVALEKELSKEQILEMYLNCIYLSQGCNGVQTAANMYFDKDVSALNLAECASLAGITQHPSLYDPFVNPEKNKERQQLVLGKMLELGYITQDEYNEASQYKLQFADPEKKRKENEQGTTSYFVDQVIRDVQRDLMAKGYSESLANKILYSGGVKVYASYNPKIQKAVEEYYKNVKHFPDKTAQSAMVVMDVQTGQVVGIAGGIGEKEGNLTLNRATQSQRQPGSIMKPVAVYAPAIEKGVINAGSVYDDEKKTYNGWTPRNYDFQYRGRVGVREAVRKSLNTVPVEILSQMGAQTSYDFLTQKLGFTSLVANENINGSVYTDIGYSQLALGGLTHGATVMEMAASYCTFANGGVYHKPYTYEKVVDKDGRTVLDADKSTWQAMKPSTAYIMSQMLKEVVTSGTGRGAGVSSGIFTAGKTGTTSENNDRWFAGFTPYYAAVVWYGYDIPKEITSSANPCIPVFQSVMSDIHSGMKWKEIEEPKGEIVSVTYCEYTGKRATNSCPKATYYFTKDNMPSEYCGSNHSGYKWEDAPEDDKKSDPSETQKPNENENNNQSGGTRGTANPSGQGTQGSQSGQQGTGTTGSSGGQGSSGSGSNSGSGNNSASSQRTQGSGSGSPIEVEDD